MNKKVIYKGACISDVCRSSDAFTVYQNTDTGTCDAYCFSCNTYFPPTQLQDWNDLTTMQARRHNMADTILANTARTIDEVLQSTVIAAIPERGLTLEVCEMFGIRVTYDEQTGQISRHYYPYYKGGKLTAFKVRNTTDKGFYVIGDMKGAALFGQQLYSAAGKLLIITEGELDAASAVQMLKASGKSYRVVSLSNGANISSIQNNLEWLQGFESLFLNLDNDAPGIAATKDISELFETEKCRIMHLSEKDANALLLANKSKEYLQAVFSATPYKPEGIVSIADIIEEAMQPVEEGLSWPWPSLTKFTYGARRKEVYGFGAGSGAGKTEAFKEIICHWIWEHQLPVGVFFLEEAVTKTAKVVAGKRHNKRFHVPDGTWTQEELREALEELQGKMYMFNHFGAKDWDNIKAKIRYMNKALGVRDFFIDHLTALTAQEENEYHAMNKIMEEIASLAHQLDITIFYISHLVKTNPPHEEGGKVSAAHFRGSGAIIFWSNFLFGVERNQMDEDAVKRNTSILRVLKDRNTGEGTGEFMEMWYDHTTGRWGEKKASQSDPEWLAHDDDISV